MSKYRTRCYASDFCSLESNIQSSVRSSNKTTRDLWNMHWIVGGHNLPKDKDKCRYDEFLYHFIRK